MNLETIGIVGAGQMGGGIAQVCAAAGLRVILTDARELQVRNALSTIAANLQRQVEKGKLDTGERESILERITGVTGFDSFSECDFVIEAATENSELKQTILRELDKAASKECIIATNTSSVSVTRLATELADPARFVGMHFFNPVPAMQLVEVVRGMQTGDATYEKTEALARRLGKSPVRIRNSPGFAVNRILIPMINEAAFALQEGVADAEEIDLAMKLGANHPLGPLALADLIGIDTCLAIMEVLHQEFGDSKYRPAPLLREMVDAGRFGRKSGQGFFRY